MDFLFHIIAQNSTAVKTDVKNGDLERLPFYLQVDFVDAAKEGMRVVAEGLDQAESEGFVEMSQLFVFVDHQKTDRNAAVGGSAVDAVCNECLSDPAVLILGQDRKALEGINAVGVLFDLNRADELALDPGTVNMRAAFLFVLQLLKRHKRAAGGVNLLGESEALAIDTKRPVDGFEAGDKLGILDGGNSVTVHAFSL